ncbi:coiled-coil domain-containing protein 154 isoform X5 [Peromyscus leucopus]|uniref:coiled-coil domain-containing protein 154 isoform X5 n=1 Tax=Peromyscus leucopus TaxID=10041 RepID=UPI00188577D0|nr:coiled-coil domain-containing protein 154 isoform X5 [Peromyscus leucopus]
MHELPRCLLPELADSSSLGLSPPSQLSNVTLEDLELLLTEGLASPEPLCVETPERYECSGLVSSSLVPEHDTPKQRKLLEQWVAELQAEVLRLRGHKDRCEHVTLGLLRELLQVRAHVQQQASELHQLRQEVQQAARSPKKEALELSGPQSQNQIKALDKRLVEVREALTQIRRTQVLQDSERKCTEQEISLRVTKLTDLLRQEEQGREAACSTLQRNQEDTNQKVDRGLAKMQDQVTKFSEDLSIRFLKRETKLCSFLQKCFMAMEQRMKSSESTRLMAESSLREELESRWQKLHELTEERLRALRTQREQEEEGHLLEQCRGLDKAVVYLTKFVRQNQVSLNRVLLAEQKAREAKVSLEESQAGELATYVHENLEAVQMAGKLAQQETQGALELLQEKSQVLEGSVAGLDQKLKGLNDHCLALSWKLDLQERTVDLKLSQIESVSNKCVLHQNDVDLKISAEGKAREFEVDALRQELATVLMSVQFLKEENPGRKIAEIQGQLATFQKQIIKLENSLQANKTIQNLKFNNETKLRTEEIAALRENMLSLWSEEGPWPLTLGSKRVFMSLVRQRFFIKDIALGELVSVNSWGVYQAVRWAAESLGLLRVAAQPQGVALWMSCVSGQVASVEDSPLELGGPSKTRSNLSDDPLEACTQDHVSDPVPEIKTPVLVPVGARVSCCLMETAFPQLIGLIRGQVVRETDQTQKAQVVWPWRTLPARPSPRHFYHFSRHFCVEAPRPHLSGPTPATCEDKCKE